MRQVKTRLTAWVLAAAGTAAFADPLPDETLRQLEDARVVRDELAQLVPQIEARGGGQYSRMALDVIDWCSRGILEKDLPAGYTNRVIREAWQLAEIARPALERAQRILAGSERDWTVPRFRSGNALRREGALLIGERTWPDGRVEADVPVFLNGWGHFGLVREEMPLLNRSGYNFIQIEHGIYNFLPAKGVVASNAIDEVLAVADKAWAANTQMAFLLSPHYVPGWIHQELPADNGTCTSGFMPICIHDPHVNSIFAGYCGLAASLAKDHPAIHSFTLMNEPHGGDVSGCKSMKALWVGYLTDKYGTVAELNAKWKTSYASFDGVEMQKFPTVAATPAGLEFIRCDRKAMGDFNALLAASTKAAAPNKPCHAKVVSNDCLYGAGFESFWTIDLRRFAQIYDYLDNDPIAFDHWDPNSLYAARWQENEAAYDYFRSFADKPVVNTENHNVVDRNTSPLSPTHVYAALWQNVIHGQVATAFWCWERGLDDSSVMIGLAPEHPNALEAMGRCSLDAQRLSVELAPIASARPTLLVLDSLSSEILGGRDGAVFTTYAALSFLGEPVGFLTDEALVDYAQDGVRRPPFDSAKVIVLASTSHLPTAAITALRSLEAAGVKIVAVGRPLGYDDFGQPLAEATSWQPLALGDDETLQAAFAQQMAGWNLSERPRAVTVGTTTPAFGVETRGYVTESGIRRISLCNQLRRAITVDVGASGVDLITGRHTGRTIELASRVPVFIELGTVPKVVNPSDFASPSPYVLGDETVSYVGLSGTVTNDLELTGNTHFAVTNADTVLTWRGTIVSAGGTFLPHGAGQLSFVAPSNGTTLVYNSIKTCDDVTAAFADYQLVSGNGLYGLGGSVILRNVAEWKCADFIMGIDGGRCDLTVTDGTSLKTLRWPDYESNWGSGNRVLNGSTLTVEKGAKVSHVALHVDGRSSATVTSGGILAFSRPNLACLAEKGTHNAFGSVMFDGGILKSFDDSYNRAVDSRIYAQWFNGHDELTVGVNGMTIQTPDASGVLWPYFKLAEGVTTATITKTGMGSLAIRPTSLPVDVTVGELRLAAKEYDADRARANGKVTFAAGTSVTLAGEHSAAKMDLSGAPLVKFQPDGQATTPDKWKANGWATTRADGVLQLSDSATAWSGRTSPGSAFRHEKIAVDRSFEVAFSVTGYNIMGGNWHDQKGGFALVFQNATAGTSAVADEYGNSTLGGFQGAVRENGVGLIVSGQIGGEGGNGLFFRVAKGTADPTELGKVTVGGRINYDGFDKPVRVVFTYDHVNKKGFYTLTQTSSGSATPSDSFEFDLDLPALVGANTATFGFTGSAFAGWLQTVYAVGEVAVTDETMVPTVARSGGVMTVAAGAHRSFQTFGDKGNSGFLMDTLTYGDRTTLDIAPLNVLDTANSFAGFETYVGAGTLVKTGVGNFGAVGEAAKDVALEVAAGGVVLRQETSAGNPAQTTKALGLLNVTTARATAFCETATTGGVFKITNGVTLPSNGVLAVNAPYAPATLDLGTLMANGEATLDLGTNATASVGVATGVKTLTVNGGTLRLTSASALSAESQIVLTDDARLALDFNGTMRPRKVVRNGQPVEGRIDAALDWVTGRGAIRSQKGLTVNLR